MKMQEYRDAYETAVRQRKKVQAKLVEFKKEKSTELDVAATSETAKAHRG
eukprot:TRINITY_DN1967_c0_g1_i1.p2 TRINITY_DN1967_c0_g1~~TRINITY_DN1967_c0_g1_i1.p2  ORF type:complete len:50 (+),score=24.69 TRINITY_DN1967_c0_g1_i1:279-428(+)